MALAGVAAVLLAVGGAAAQTPQIYTNIKYDQVWVL